MAVKYTIMLPDKTALEVADPTKVAPLASQKAKELNHILSVFEEDEYGIRKEFATVYPNGEIRKPVSISDLAKSMKTTRR